MKQYGIVLVLCLSQQALSMHEKTPLLSTKQSFNHLQDALTLLQKTNFNHIGKELSTEIKKCKKNSAKKRIVQQYLQTLKDKVQWIKENYVHRDSQGNYSPITFHQLDPVINLLKEYVGN